MVIRTPWGISLQKARRRGGDAQRFSVRPPASGLARGTRVETPEGPRAVETLRIGERVCTTGSGDSAVHWIGRSRLFFQTDRAEGRPFCLPEGCLGGGRPRESLLLAPEHRVALSSPAVRRLFGDHEVLVAARDLGGLPGVREMRGKREVDYVTLMLDAHRLVLAGGQPVESLLPDARALDRLTPAKRFEIAAILPAPPQARRGRSPRPRHAGFSPARRPGG